MVDLAKGLLRLHENGWVHLDLKPQNVMLNFEGMFKLSDFRYSRMLDSPVEHVKDSIGTEAYLSPELKSTTEKKRIGCFTDIWCLGLTLHQMCQSS